MSELRKLSESEINDGLQALPSWKLADGQLHREYKFKDFVAAFAFMTKVAGVAEAIGHHPEWFNVYNRVDVRLSTHDVDGISENDFELARRMDELAG